MLQTVQVQSIEYVDIPDEYVYDIEVEGNHNFFIRPVGANSDVLVSNCHQLTGASAQALLKPLEEPPPHALWILATTNPEKLNSAIVGRCQVLNLPDIKKEDLTEFLGKVAKKEKMELSDEVLSTIAESSGGHVRNALNALEGIGQYLHGGSKGTDKEISSEILRLAVNSADYQVEQVATKVLLGLYLGKIGVAVKAIGDLSDGIQTANRMLQFTQYAIDLVCGAKGNQVWHTIPNKNFYTALIKHAGDEPKLAILAVIMTRLVQMRDSMQSFSVPERFMFTGVCIEIVRDVKKLMKE